MKVLSKFTLIGILCLFALAIVIVIEPVFESTLWFQLLLGMAILTMVVGMIGTSLALFRVQRKEERVFEKWAQRTTCLAFGIVGYIALSVEISSVAEYIGWHQTKAIVTLVTQHAAPVLSGMFVLNLLMMIFLGIREKIVTSH